MTISKYISKTIAAVIISSLIRVLTQRPLQNFSSVPENKFDKLILDIL